MESAAVTTDVWARLLEGLLLQGGWNASLVTIGAALLGMTAGGSGVFLVLRKRALVSDAVAHATLPGVAGGFLVMAALGGSGKSLLGLLAGAAATAVIGLYLIEWMTRRTRLSEDAAIGAVLSVFFGLGVVMLTIIQSAAIGGQAGLEDFLLGSAAGMLFEEAALIAAGGAAALMGVWVLRRPLTLTAFDPDFAAAAGYDVRRADLLSMGLVTIITVVGLKIVGLVLIVALLIIPAVTARLWTDRAEAMVWRAAAVGGLAGYVGASISFAAPNAPTGPVIVLVCAGLFALSLIGAPRRGLIAAAQRRFRFQRRVHVRQGLLALARNEPILERYTLRLLVRAGLARPDGVATEAGRAQAAKTQRDEIRWETARRIHQDAALTGRYDGLTPIEAVFTADEIAEFDRRIGPPQMVAPPPPKGA